MKKINYSEISKQKLEYLNYFNKIFGSPNYLSYIYYVIKK
jgi:hypothetical protein